MVSIFLLFEPSLLCVIGTKFFSQFQYWVRSKRVCTNHHFQILMYHGLSFKCNSPFLNFINHSQYIQFPKEFSSETSIIFFTFATVLPNLQRNNMQCHTCLLPFYFWTQDKWIQNTYNEFFFFFQKDTANFCKSILCHDFLYLFSFLCITLWFFFFSISFLSNYTLISYDFLNHSFG